MTDNDFGRSGETVVMQCSEAFHRAGIPLTYLVEPVQNIALARNSSLKSASGRFIAFIDDDERASPRWLDNLYSVMTNTASDGVWGPVIPEIPASFPKWMHASNLFRRENPEDCSPMRNRGLKTGNMLIKRELLLLRDGPFDESLGRIGGSDSELFNWISWNQKDVKYVWAAKAEVFESIEEKRRQVKWHVRRAYRGGWGFSRGLAQRYGVGRGFLLSTIRTFPSLAKALGNAIINFKNIRYAGLIVIMSIATNLGKLGYFFGITVEEYQG